MESHFLPRLPALFALASVCVIAGNAGAADTVPEADSPSKVKPGTTALLQTSDSKLKMRFFLRLPKSYNARVGARLIVFLHGSNMNGLTYLRSFEAKSWCLDDILVCPNGEQGSDPHGKNNFTFDSAPLVAAVTREVKQAFKVDRAFVGGHSQGGFLTYSVILLFPDLFQGAFPMAGDCWMQNEPNLWETQSDVLAKQKQIAIAVIHGKADPVVQFSQGEHAHAVFLAMGYPRLRFFAPENLGHQFMLSPVPEAIEWLDAMVGPDAKQRLRLASGWVKAKEWGWAFEAAKGVAELKKAPAEAKKQARAAQKIVEEAAGKELKGMVEAMAKEPPEKWIPRWYEFRRQFGRTDAAGALVKKYEDDRAAQRAAAKRLLSEARECFKGNDKDGGKTKLRELLQSAPAAYEAYYALEWLKG